MSASKLIILLTHTKNHKNKNVRDTRISSHFIKVQLSQYGPLVNHLEQYTQQTLQTAIW